MNKSLIFLTVRNLSSINANIVALIFKNTNNFLNVGKQSLSAKFSASVKLDISKIIGWLPLSYPRRYFYIQFFLLARRAQSGSRIQRQWSLFESQA